MIANMIQAEPHLSQDLARDNPAFEHEAESLGVCVN